MKKIIQYYQNLIEKFLLPVCTVFVSVLLVTSCTDVLDTTASDRFTEDAVWGDVALIDAYIANTYRSIPNGFRYPLYSLSVVSDELNARSNTWAWGVISGNLTPDNLQHINYWTNFGGGNTVNRSYWKTISLANEFFENIDRDRETPINESTLNHMIGEMKTIRAKSYFKLISLFGGVPLITNTFSLDEDFRRERDSYDEVMNFVLNELEEAIPLLPLQSELNNAEYGRVTRGAAMALKARVLLYRASPLNNPSNDLDRWQEAQQAARDVIDLNEYALFDDYRTMFLEENIYNSEMIWQRPYNQFVSSEAVYVELSSYPNGYNGFGQIHPIQNLVDDFETINGLLPENDPDYDPQNPYEDRDPRFYATILHDGAPFKHREVETFLPGGLDSNEGPVSAWNATETGYYSRKFVNERITDPSGSNMSQTPWTWFRYAEVLLNYAEASYFLGQEDITREFINKVRSRPSVDMPEVTESGDALFERLVNERRIELVFEEHRWFDVRRWEIAPEVLNEDWNRIRITLQDDGTKQYEVVHWQEANFNAPRDYLLPIPQSEIDRNALLEQNPGYN
jgi:starch-binding outer membrane protein, SusD/RagB family